MLQVLEWPAPEGWARAADMRRKWVALTAHLQRASATFARMEDGRINGESLRTVFASGDILTKANDFANGGLYHRLSEKGVRIVAEPLCDFLEYLACLQPRLLFGQGATGRQVMMYKANMILIRGRLYALIRQRHPWLPRPDVKAALNKTTSMLDTSTVGGATLAVGSVLQQLEKQCYDSTPLDERRINSFTFHLHRNPRQAAPAS